MESANLLLSSGIESKEQMKQIAAGTWITI